MDASHDHTTLSRSGWRRLISPWEYLHPHAFAGVRFAGGGFCLCLGLVLISLGHRGVPGRERRKCYWLAAWFLANAALQFVGGYMDMTVARSTPPQT